MTKQYMCSTCEQLSIIVMDFAPGLWACPRCYHEMRIEEEERKQYDAQLDLKLNINTSDSNI